jgi:hypothetical protein
MLKAGREPELEELQVAQEQQQQAEAYSAFLTDTISGTYSRSSSRNGSGSLVPISRGIACMKLD